MRILILCFSGTGNTLRIADLLCREFSRLENECRVLPVERITQGKETLEPGAWDLIGIGFPVHAMDAPQIVYDLVNLLPKASQKYFLFKTAGSPFLRGGSTIRIREKLANLGWKLRHEQLYVMPPNAFGTARQSKVDKRYYRSRELAVQSASEIISGVRVRVPEAPLRTACYAFAALEKYGARQSSARWTVNADCTLCGLCAAQCPTGNITIEQGKLVFSEKCLICLRCWWNCPTRALSHKSLRLFFLKAPYKLPEI